ncbi:hypothetical protein NDU88_006878 [Pleurodeles waltl]|uniref:Uncharacterized protein n=1 Tax=Pleurodeles waltl TaxID=8319 RepID=A0AAV7RNH5_PLEWA|nr:hypothetical protein NDU88_006878 [Pleurodeles waltl]
MSTGPWLAGSQSTGLLCSKVVIVDVNACRGRLPARAAGRQRRAVGVSVSAGADCSSPGPRGGVRGISGSDERHFRFRFLGQHTERRTQLARTGEPPSLQITGHGSLDHRERPTHSLTLNRACHRCPQHHDNEQRRSASPIPSPLRGCGLRGGIGA